MESSVSCSGRPEPGFFAPGPPPVKLLVFLPASVAWIMGACASASGVPSGAAGGGGDAGGAVSPPETGGVAPVLEATGPGTNAAGAAASGGVATGGGGTGGSNGCERFSFFVTSLAAMLRESGRPDGFGGDLGGLSGADDVCRRIAEAALPCAGQKQWRAFLSTTTEDAIDRVGFGPWYDRVGRLVASTPGDLASERPLVAGPEIIDDLPNEEGVPNHAPDGTFVDNHDVLTGSDEQGRFVAAGGATCNDWTSSAAGSPRPRVGHAWPASSLTHWISAHDASGCLPGVNLTATGAGASGSVGAMGGYGAIYCLALAP
jgi:hypothetical protein